MNYFRIDRILLGWLALALAQTVAGVLVRVPAPAIPHGMEWMLATDLLIVITLALLAAFSEWSGWKLAAALTAIPFAINFVNMVEGAVFLERSGIPWRSLLPMLCLTYVLVLPLWRYIFRGSTATTHFAPTRGKSFGGLAWRFLLSDFVYLFLYFGAGVVIWPYVKDFYSTQIVPSAGTIVSLQLVFRGPVFVIICLLMVRMIGFPRWKGALSVGLAFTVLSGVAPLLMPNPYFPDAVRWVHFGEVVTSNFVFGVTVGLIWGKPQTVSIPQASKAAA